MNQLPQRDKTKPAEQQGLFQKFNVTRTDGKDAPGQKHCGCEYFVLDATHDIYAKAALTAYAAACAESHPDLSNDMVQRYALPLPEVNQEPFGWCQYADGIRTQNFARDESELKNIKEISELCGKGMEFKYIPVFALPPDVEALRKENEKLKAEVESFSRMLIDACSDLGLINEALGLDPDDGGAEPILEAIAKLKGGAA